MRQYLVIGNTIGLACFAVVIVLAGFAIPAAGLVLTSFLATTLAAVGWLGVVTCRHRALFHQVRARHWLQRLEVADDDDAAHRELLETKGAPASLTSVWIGVLATTTVVSAIAFLISGLASLDA